MKFNVDHDYHLHSFLSTCSHDEGQTKDAIFHYAEENHLKEICITDHFWDSPAVAGASSWYLPQDFPHISSILPLPQSDDVHFHFGCETEMSRDFRLAITKEHMERMDFIIVPTTHMHMSSITPKEAGVDERREIYLARVNHLLDMDDLPFHKMGWAHPTDSLIAPNGTWQQVIDGISDAEYLAVLSKLQKRGMGFEMNTSNFNFDRLTPDQLESELRVYRLAKEAGCKFYLGSDAHTRDELAVATDRARKLMEVFPLTEDDRFHPFHD